ncbi:MAG: hypothetical protein Q7T57_01170, partial [Dehalococcoidales bacterium]|nr:hypothetical protein [Dehalococcoidales bacterium]
MDSTPNPKALMPRQTLVDQCRANRQTQNDPLPEIIAHLESVEKVGIEAFSPLEKGELRGIFNSKSLSISLY